MFKCLRPAVYILFLTNAVSAPLESRAGELGAPDGPVILSISGGIGVTNAGDEAQLDRAMFEGLGLVELHTTTPSTTGTQVFEGVGVGRLLETVQAQGRVVRAWALNDYVVDIDISFATDSEALIAVKMNGEYMRVRDKGPLWIVFPWQQRPELDDEYVKSLLVWQLNRLEIR